MAAPASVPVGSIVTVRAGVRVRLHEGRDARGRGEALSEGPVAFQVHGYVARHPRSRTEFVTTSADGVEVVRLASVPVDADGDWDHGPGGRFLSVALSDVEAAGPSPAALAGLAEEGAALLDNLFGGCNESLGRILH